jgi:hypothetical protein
MLVGVQSLMNTAVKLANKPSQTSQLGPLLNLEGNQRLMLKGDSDVGSLLESAI